MRAETAEDEGLLHRGGRVLLTGLLASGQELFLTLLETGGKLVRH